MQIDEVISQDTVSKVKYTAKEFASAEDPRWCPGCGDYSVLAQVQRVLPELNIPKEKLCSFPELVVRAAFHIT